MTELITVQYDCYLLAAATLAAAPLRRLMAGSTFTLIGRSNGFVDIVLADGQRGFLPSAWCGAVLVKPTPARSIRPVLLAATPSIQAPTADLVPVNEPLELLEPGARFSKIRRENGSVGFVPTLLVTLAVRQNKSTQASPAASLAYYLKQPVMLYALPLPGAQKLTGTIVSPNDQLLLLGKDATSALVQRADGRVGYVPVGWLDGAAEPGALLPIGSVDLGWLVIGLVWGIVNCWTLIQAFATVSLIPAGLGIPLVIAILVIAAAAIIIRGRHPLLARSFGVGMLLASLAILTQQR